VVSNEYRWTREGKEEIRKNKKNPAPMVFGALIDFKVSQNSFGSRQMRRKYYYLLFAFRASFANGFRLSHSRIIKYRAVY
jgi:hypothetical protein